MARFDMKDKKVIDGVRPETLKIFNEGFIPPSADEVKFLIGVAGLTGSNAGKLLGVNGRTIRKWTGGESAMPYASWRVLCQYVGLVGVVLKTNSFMKFTNYTISEK